MPSYCNAQKLSNTAYQQQRTISQRDDVILMTIRV